MNIPSYVSEIISRIELAGFEAYAVGGCVRDSLLGKTPCDWDVTTSAYPENILSLFSDMKTIPTGLQHGTVTVISRGKPVEITTYRIDGKYADSRHPESVVFTRSLREDQKRRDFTVNAMAYNPKSGLKDEFGGINDLNSKTLRAVGNPKDRFSEDALRIMRALRFSATLGFSIEEKTSEALFICAPLLSDIAAERISDEFLKTVTAPNPELVLNKYNKILIPVFFGYDNAESFHGTNFDAMAKLPQHPCLRLAAYFALLVADAESTLSLAARFFSKMKYSNQIKTGVLSILKLSETEIPADRIMLKKLLSRTDSNTVAFALQLKTAISPCSRDTISALSELDSILKSNECFSLKQLEISGSDLIKESGLSGTDVGKALNFLLGEVICGNCPNKKDALLNLLRNTSFRKTKKE